MICEKKKKPLNQAKDPEVKERTYDAYYFICAIEWQDQVILYRRIALSLIFTILMPLKKPFISTIYTLFITKCTSNELN